MHRIVLILYLPKILLRRRHSGVLFQTAPSSHLSFQGIYHIFDECLRILAMDRCMNGWHVQCAQKGVCYTVKKERILYWEIKLLMQRQQLLFLHVTFNSRIPSRNQMNVCYWQPQLKQLRDYTTSDKKTGPVLNIPPPYIKPFIHKSTT